MCGGCNAAYATRESTAERDRKSVSAISEERKCFWQMLDVVWMRAGGTRHAVLLSSGEVTRGRNCRHYARRKMRAPAESASPEYMTNVSIPASLRFFHRCEPSICSGESLPEPRNTRTAPEGLPHNNFYLFIEWFRVWRWEWMNDWLAPGSLFLRLSLFLSL